MAIADSDQFLLVTTSLLRADPSDAAAKIAHRAGVAEPTTHRILRFYRYHGAIRQGRGALRPDKRKVFQLAAALRRGQAVPSLVMRNAPDQSTLLAQFDRNKIPFVLGSATAANLLAYFEPAPEITLYLDKADAPKAKRIIRQGKGHSRVHIRYGDPKRMTTVQREGVRVTEPFRTLLDAAADPTAGAHAEFLYQTLVEGQPP